MINIIQAILMAIVCAWFAIRLLNAACLCYIWLKMSGWEVDNTVYKPEDKEKDNA